MGALKVVLAAVVVVAGGACDDRTSSDRAAETDAAIGGARADAASPDSSAPMPDAAAETPDAAAQTPDAAAQAPDAAGPTPDAAAETPDAAAQTPDAAGPTPDAAAQTPDAAAQTPDATPEPDAAPPCMPIPEICDGLDNDCNDVVDDAPGSGVACAAGLGACEAAGTVVCDVGLGALRCDAVPGLPDTERCNGVDDDCNGVVDDGEIRVGVMGGAFYTDDARSDLDALPNVVAEVNPSCALEDLARYDALLVHGNMDCFDDAAFTQYVDTGGGLIGMPWVLGNYGGLEALPVADAGLSEPLGPLAVTVVEPGSPLLNLVDFTGGDGMCTPLADVPYTGDVDCVGVGRPLTLRPGAQVVATHDAVAGSPAIAAWDYGQGRAVYLDFHFITSDTAIAARYPWGRQLLRNAVESVTGCPAGPPVVCPPGVAGPIPERCNGVDDDCNGVVDDTDCPPP
jgi:hypothetical protein